MDDKNFNTDPLFNSLRNFAAKDSLKSEMPNEVLEAYRIGNKKQDFRKYTLRTFIGLLLLALTMPALANANVLPQPMKEFVQSVQKAAISPVKQLLNINQQINEPGVGEQGQPEEKVSGLDKKDEQLAKKEAKQEDKALDKALKESQKAAKKEEQLTTNEAKKEAKAQDKALKVIQKAETKSEKSNQSAKNNGKSDVAIDQESGKRSNK